MERVDAPRGSQAVSALGLPLVLEAAMVLQVEFPLELPVVVSPGGVAVPRGQEPASRVGLRLTLKVAPVIGVQLPPGSVVVV